MILPKHSIREMDRTLDLGQDRADYIRLDKNERTIGYPDTVLNEIVDRLRQANWSMYPDQTTLYSSLANFLALPESRILLTSGADTAIKYIFETFVSTNDRVVHLDPTYAMAEVYAVLFGAKTQKISFDDNLGINADEILSEVNDQTRLIYLANPNQPTGTVIPIEQLEAIISHAQKTDTLVVIDEAYIQFSQIESAIKLIDQYSNLIVIQSFSKAFGVAPARLGFIVSTPEICNWIRKVKPIHDINLFALEIGTYLIANFELVTSYVNEVRQSAAYLEKFFAKYDIEVVSTHTNFIHIRMPTNTDPKTVTDEFLRAGYLVRANGDNLPKALRNSIRVTMGPLSQMEIFARHLISIIS